MLNNLTTYFSFILSRFSKSLKYAFFSTAFIALISNINLLVIPILQKNMIEQISDMHLNLTMVMWILGLGILGVILKVLETLILLKLKYTTQNRLQKEFLESAIRHDNKIVKHRGAGAYIINLLGDSEQICGLIGTNYFQVGMICISSITVLFITLQWSWVFCVVTIPTFILMILILYISNKIYKVKYDKGRELIFEINPKIQEYIENNKTILGYGDAIKYEEQLYQLFDDRDKQLSTGLGINTLAEALVDTLKTISMIIFFILSMIEIQNGHLQISEFIAMISYYSQIFIPISLIQGVNFSMNRFGVLHEKNKENLGVVNKFSLDYSNSLSMQNCGFQYGENNKNVANLSFDVDKKIGLVGLSGEGKSTIIKILLGDIVPHDGKCLYGNSNISDISKSIRYSAIKLYSQEPEIFNRDMLFNITLGKKPLLEQQYNDKIIELNLMLDNCFAKIRNTGLENIDKAEKSLLQTIFLVSPRDFSNKDIANNIVDSVKKFPQEHLKNLASLITSKHYYIQDRYNKLVCDLDIASLANRDLGQRGANISGGEKNKICLARFLLSSHDSFFVIDEPFTSVDAISEQICMKVLAEHIQNSKGIIISHKLDIIEKLSNEIFVLEDGVIAERGEHLTLMNTEGLYNKLVTTYYQK